MPTGIGIAPTPEFFYAIPGIASKLSKLGRMLQHFPAFTYEPTTIGGRYAIADVSREGMNREPRQQRVHTYDGVDDYATLGALLTGVNTTTLSCSAWIKCSGAVDKTIASEFAAAGNQRSWRMFVDTSGSLSVTATDNGSGTRLQYLSTTLVNNNVWHHVGFTFNAGVLELYVDGAVAAVTKPTDLSCPFLFNAATVFMVGARDSGTAGFFAGSLKDVRVYGVVKTPTEMASIYNQSQAPQLIDSVGLLAHYACEEESGLIVYDSSGNSKHLLITGVVSSGSTIPGGSFHVPDATLPHSMGNEYGASYGRVMLRTVAGTFNGSWQSANVLTGDGFVEFVIDSLSTTVVIGLSIPYTPASINVHTQLTFAVHYLSATTVRFLASGNIENVVTATLANGDRIRFIRRGGSLIDVQQNGVTFYTFIATNSNPLVAAVALTANTEAGVCSSFNGVEPTTGNTQAVVTSVRAFPRVLLNNTLDALGNTVQYTGQVPHYATADAPCVTGDGLAGTYVQLGSALIPPTADFEISGWFYHLLNSTGQRNVIAQYVDGVNYVRLLANVNGAMTAVAGSIVFQVFVGGVSQVQIAADNALGSAEWHKYTIRRVGSNFTVTIARPAVKSVVVFSGTSVAAIPQGTTQLLALNNGASQPNNGRICDLIFTTGGVTKYFPLQSGPGDATTNRDVSWFASNNTYGVVANALVGSTVSAMWANNCPYAVDYALLRGSRVDAGVTYPTGTGTTATNGQPITHQPGQWNNIARNHRLNFNPYSAAGLNGTGAETAYVGAAARQPVAPVDSKYRRTRGTPTFLDDRFLIAGTRTGYTLVGLVGLLKQRAEKYVL